MEMSVHLYRFYGNCVIDPITLSQTIQGSSHGDHLSAYGDPTLTIRLSVCTAFSGAMCADTALPVCCEQTPHYIYKVDKISSWATLLYSAYLEYIS